MGGSAWVTLATNDSYSLGALVLAHSLRKVATAHQLAVLITPAVSPAMRDQLASVYDVVKVVDVLDSKDEANLALLKRPELGITFTKLHCWQLTQFEKGVFLDADTLVIRNSDELFEREEFSAAPDIGWPDCFNSGVFVFRPSVETFNNLLQFAVEKGSFDGGDQGLLNQFFNTWATADIKKHLPFVYNLTSVAVYSYKPAFKQYGADTRIVHFIGPVKPWLQPVDPSSRTVTPTADSEHLQPLLQQWWDLFIEKVHPGLSASLDCDNGLLRFFALPTCSTDPLDSTPARSDPPPPPVEPSFPEPYTPYIEKDDERQYNLPYQPFQVVSSEGELLNITFSDFARDSDLKETECAECDNVHPVADFVESVVEHDEQEIENDKEQFDEEPKPEEEIKLPPYEDNYVEETHFNYHSFVPDEGCIQAYLEHNVQEYQAIEHSSAEEPPPPPPDSVWWEPPALPRFLTIPEDDQRQSNVVYVREPSPERHWSNEEQQSWVPWEMPAEQHIEPTYDPVPARAPSPVHHTAEPDHAITRSKSMSNLNVDTANASIYDHLTTWKSQPEVSVETPKKLPGLKPLLPKEKLAINVITKPKYTESTEVHMINTSTDPFAPPIDTVGFVERAIMKRALSQKAMFNIPQGALEPDIPVVEKIPIPPIFVPREINEYVDLADCKRQAGNQLMPNELKPAKEERVPRRKGKRPVRRAADKWKPPETFEATYDVDSVMKRLSEFSAGYKPPVLQEETAVPTHDFSKYRDYVASRSEVSSRGLAAFEDIASNGHVESAADRLFRESSEQLEEKSKNIINRNVLSHSNRFVPIAKKTSKKRSKRGLKADAVLKPFAAPPGESLSEMEATVPEIVVCVASPLDEDVEIGDGIISPVKSLDETYVVTSQAKDSSPPSSTDEILLVKVTESSEGSELVSSEISLFETATNVSGESKTNGSALSDESFVSAKSTLSPEEEVNNSLIEINSKVIVESPATAKVVPSNDFEDLITDRLSKLHLNGDSKENNLAENTITSVVETEIVPFTDKEQLVHHDDKQLESVEELSKKMENVTVLIDQVTTGEKVVQSELDLHFTEDPKITSKFNVEDILIGEVDAKQTVLNNQNGTDVAQDDKDAEENILVCNNTVEISPNLSNKDILSNEDLEKTESFFLQATVEALSRNGETTEYEKTEENKSVEPFQVPLDNVAVEEEILSTLSEIEEQIEEIIMNINVPMSMQSKLCYSEVVQNQALNDNRAIETESGFNSLTTEQGIGIVANNDEALTKPEITDELEISEDSLQFNLRQLVSDDDVFSSLETSSPSQVTQPLFDVAAVEPLLSYAAAAKKESSGPINLTSIKPLPSTSKPTKPPTQQNGVKPKKTRKLTPMVSPSLQLAPILPSTKVVKRKADKMDVEYPVNRFELLEEEIEEDVEKRKKKVKKVTKRFVTPSSSNSSPPPLAQAIVEEDTQLYLGEPDDNPGIAGAIAQLSLDPSKSTGSPTDCSAAQAEYLRRQSWETGKMDYMGRDSFANVWSKISQTLSLEPLPEDASPTSPNPPQ